MWRVCRRAARTRSVAVTAVAAVRSVSQAVADTPNAASMTTRHDGAAEALSVHEAEVVRETTNTHVCSSCSSCNSSDSDDKAVAGDAGVLHDAAAAAAGVSHVADKEALLLELHKLHYALSQDGPYIGSRVGDRRTDLEVDARTRRAVTRVPQPEVPYLAAETSFRRLPRDVRLPNEYELRALYPMSTTLTLLEGQAECVDVNASDMDAPPLPVPYSILAPPQWDETRPHPYLVVLPDHGGQARDFADVCANLFERPLHRQLMCEQGWVVLSPHLPMRFSLQAPNEGIVARFCDWVCTRYAVEHGRVHLFGKGYGAYAALRTVLEYKGVAASVVALLGRNGSPLRVNRSTQKLAQNYQGVHSLVYVPGFLFKQDYYYKFKGILDMMRVRPPLRNVHFAEVFDHQLYYAINPYELWNYMRYFREHTMTALTSEGGHVL